MWNLGFAWIALFSISSMVFISHLLFPYCFICSLREKVQVEQLLHYITEEPPEDADKKHSFKWAIICLSYYSCFNTSATWLFVEFGLQYRFPFIACEIFTCEVDIILRALVEDVQVNVSMKLLTAYVWLNMTTLF